jgi:hypothetical protein
LPIEWQGSELPVIDPVSLFFAKKGLRGDNPKETAMFNFWRQRLYVASGILLLLSACALEMETLFFHAWPLKHVQEWMMSVDTAKIAAGLGLLFALAGTGWRRLAFMATGIIELWMIWPLGNLG